MNKDRRLDAQHLCDVGPPIGHAGKQLEALQRQPIRRAVLDVSMPGMSGIDAYERARASGWSGAVLFVSGYTASRLLASPLSPRRVMRSKRSETWALNHKPRFGGAFHWNRPKRARVTQESLDALRLGRAKPFAERTP